MLPILNKPLVVVTDALVVTWFDPSIWGAAWCASEYVVDDDCRSRDIFSIFLSPALLIFPEKWSVNWWIGMKTYATGIHINNHIAFVIIFEHGLCYNNRSNNLFTQFSRTPKYMCNEGADVCVCAVWSLMKLNESHESVKVLRCLHFEMAYVQTMFERQLRSISDNELEQQCLVRDFRASVVVQTLNEHW